MASATHSSSSPGIARTARSVSARSCPLSGCPTINAQPTASPRDDERPIWDVAVSRNPECSRRGDNTAYRNRGFHTLNRTLTRP
jgi:hypothetical protein